MIKELAKLSAPRSLCWVKRERLLMRLEGLLSHPVVWMVAPAGSGKTVLAANYLQDRKVSAVWYNLDSGDADPASFFYYLKLAVEHQNPASGLTLPHLTPDRLPGLERFAAGFFRDTYRCFEGTGILVLDNLQDVDQSPDFLKLLLAAASEVPEGVNLLCLSRSDPPPAMSRLLVNQTVAVLGWDELKWTTDDAIALATSLAPNGISAGAVADIQQKTQGWAAGLVLMLRQAADTAGMVGSPEQATEQTLFRYFAGEILEKLPPRERAFLLRTALLPTVTADLAAQLTGDADAAALLSYMADKNYFTVRLAASPDTYRYHPLFREFLLHHAAANLSVEELNRRRVQAADLLNSNGDNEAAIPLLIAAAAWQPLTVAICLAAPQLLAHGRHLRVLEWLGEIPETIVAAIPWLLYWKAAALMPIDFDKSHELFGAAFEAFVNQDRFDHRGVALAWSGAVETIVHALSRTERLDEWIDKMNILRERAALDRDTELQTYIAPQVVAIYALRGKMDPQLEHWLSLAQALLAQPIDATQRIMASFALVAFFHWSGQPARSGPILKQQEVILEGGDVTPLAAIITKLCAAWFSWIYGRFDLCHQAIEDGLAIVERTGVQHWTFILVVQGITSALVRNDLREAERYFLRLDPLHPYARDMDRAYYHNELAWLEHLKGRPEHSLNHQKIAVEIADSVGAPFVIAETCFGLSQAYHTIGDMGLARHYLDKAREHGELYGSQTLAFQCALVDAFYHLVDGDEQTAASIVTETFGRAKRLGYAAFAWWRQSVVARVCSFALEKGIEPVFTRNLIRQFQVMPPNTAQGDSRWPWPMRINTLGQFALIVNDEVVTFDRKAQRKPLELLKALVAFGGREVPESKLSDAVWPDAEADAAHQNLKATMHRLRKLLPTQAITVIEGRYSLDPSLCWTDTTALQSLAAEAERQPSPELLARLQSIYQGEFLHNEIDVAWAIAPREQYRALFLRTIERLGESLLASDNFSAARDCYEFGIAVDSLIEHFYQGLMRSYWGLGRPAEVQSVLARCRQVLRASLGLECSPETEALARRYSS